MSNVWCRFRKLNSVARLDPGSCLSGRPRCNPRCRLCHDSNFSTMPLIALALFDVPCDVSGRMHPLADQQDKLLSEFVTGARPEPAVLVRSGPPAFALRKPALKVMELASGRMPALWDSKSGCRFGPMSFVTGAMDGKLSPVTP